MSKRAALRFDFAPDLPAVNADGTQLRQIVMNLITNASDAIGTTVRRTVKSSASGVPSRARMRVTCGGL